MDKRDILQSLFYGIPPITSIKAIYNKVKSDGITYNEVKTFVENQEVSQIYRKQPRIKYYFPIVAKEINEIWQIDIMDMSDIYTANDNIKYFFVSIDVFSRFVSVIPLKNKYANTIIEAMKESFIIMNGKPKIINSDNGSEFINNDFKKFIKDNNIEIKYVPAGDHKKLGIIDRFIRSLREKINKYLSMRNTSKYINVFSDIVNNYNDSYHSGIKKAPRDVENKDESIIKLTNRKYNKALSQETKFNIGDEVRFIKNRLTFQKGSTPKWSKQIHEIIAKTPHTYVLDNNQVYKYYELMKVNDVEIPAFMSSGKTREQIRKENKNKRAMAREGLL